MEKYRAARFGKDDELRDILSDDEITGMCVEEFRADNGYDVSDVKVEVIHTVSGSLMVFLDYTGE